MPDTYISQFSGEEIDSALRAAQIISGADTPAELRKKLEIRGDTIPVSATDPTPVSEALTASGGGVNPNLLDNWFFGRPVNQRGQTEYTSNYTIDRWWLQADTSLNVVDGGVNVIGKWDIEQFFEKALPNRTYTLSLLYKDKTGSDPLRLIAANRSSGDVAQKITKDASGLLSITFTSGNCDKIVIGFAGSTDNVATLLAVKLELGSTQTLAHQNSSGNWVLNEIPDFGEQLRRCRDYCRKIKYATYTGYAMGVAMSANFVRIPIFFEDMRTTPTVDLSSASGLFLTGAEGDVHGVTFTLAWSAPNCIVVDATKTGAFISGQNYFLRNDATSFILASADL